MTSGMILQTALEALAVGFIIWGFLNEDKLVRFEDGIRAYFKRRRLRVAASAENRHKHCA